jgi:hypothetical protein
MEKVVTNFPNALDAANDDGSGAVLGVAAAVVLMMRILGCC